MPNYIGYEPQYGTTPRDRFTGDGTTTVFTMSQAAGSADGILVTVSGVTQDSNTYSVYNKTLTFQDPPPAAVPGQNAANIEVTYLQRQGAAIAGDALKATTGYQKLPSGVILQWGISTPGGTGILAVTFPIAFPTAAVSVVLSPLSTAPTSNQIANYQSLATTGFTINLSTHAGVAASGTVLWQAIGY